MVGAASRNRSGCAHGSSDAVAGAEGSDACCKMTSIWSTADANVFRSDRSDVNSASTSVMNVSTVDNYMTIANGHSRLDQSKMVATRPEWPSNANLRWCHEIDLETSIQHELSLHQVSDLNSEQAFVSYRCVV